MLLHVTDYTGQLESKDVSDPSTHRLLGLAAKLAYSDEAAAGAITTYWGFSEAEFQFFSRKGSQAFWAASASTCLLAFRGTSSIVDWLRDADANRIPTNGFGVVHAGFAKAVGEIWPEVTAKVSTAGSRRVFVTGHSLGGAMAKVASVRMVTDVGRAADVVCTFGQPRAGDAVFVNSFLSAYKGRSWRYVNDQDIVPHVPTFSMGFRHETARMFAPPGGPFAPDTDTEEESMAGSHATALVNVGRFAAGFLEELIRRDPDRIQDHSMDQYLAAFRS